MIKVFDTIQKLEKEEWDSLVYDNIFASHGWLKTVEETYLGQVKPQYVVIKDGYKIKAASVGYIFQKTDRVQSIDNMFFGRIEKYICKLGISFLPAYICCPLYCDGMHLLVDDTIRATRKERIVEDIVNAHENIARERRLSVHFVNIMAGENDLCRELTRKGYVKTFNQPINYIDIQWQSFSEYLDSLKTKSKRIKKDVKLQINRNRKEGVAIESIDDPGHYETRLCQLLNNNSLKYNHRPFPFKENFFRKLSNNLGENVRFYISFKRGAVTGVCVSLGMNGSGYIAFVGVDRKIAENDFTYFNIAYYRPIRDAISTGVTRLYYGSGLYELKSKRGCKLASVYSYYKPYNQLKRLTVAPWFSFLSMWNKRKLPERVMKDLA